MSISRGNLQDLLDGRPLKHALTPLIDIRPILNIDAQELEHPRHGKGKVRQISQRGAVLERNVILSWKSQSLVKNIPLPNDV